MISRLPAGVVLALLLLCSCAQGQVETVKPISIGAIYPLLGPQASGGLEELGGVRAALEVARHRGLANSARVHLIVVGAETPDQAVAAVDRLIDRDHVQVIVGTYGSSLSVAASARADARHTVYWETGAVADDVTNDRRYVFRTVATGSTLGRMAARFTAMVLLPKVALDASLARVTIVHTNDFYGRSVAAGEVAEAAAAGIGSVTSIEYDPHAFDAGEVVDRIAAARPDFLWDVSYLDDGIAVWKAVLAAHLPLRAAIGTSSAFCLPQFQQRLGAQAVGVYAADKPDQVIAPAALTPTARQLLREATAQFALDNRAEAMEIPGVAGFVGGWTLLHDVLATIGGDMTSDSIREAALKVDIPVGGEINGAGMLFAAPGLADAGQNQRAAAVVGQWQEGGVMKIVYPAAYASGEPELPGMP